MDTGEIELEINRGSDLNFQLEWEAADGSAINLTGATVAAFEPHAALDGALTLTISNAAGGIVAGRIEWRNSMPTGRHMHFRARASLPGEDISTRRIWVVVK